jgi:hypothetical protein
MTLPSCTTWECVNSFANWLSAFGMILISGLALRLSIRDRMINMRAELNTGLIPGPDPTILNRQVYILSFTNTGPRPITATNHCWSLPFVKGIIFMMPHLDRQLGPLCSKLPLELTDGKEGHIFYAADFHTRLEKTERFLCHKNRFIAWIRIRFFRVRITTTTGKRIKVVVKPAVRRKLWRVYTTAPAFVPKNHTQPAK